MFTEFLSDTHPPSEAAFDVLTVFSALRAVVGIVSWLSPSASWKAFGLSAIGADARPSLVTRLFGIRELAFAAGLRSPEPAVRKSTLQAGLVVDGMDILASIVALRRGAPKWIWLTFVAGASTFLGLGIGGLVKEESMSPR